MSQNRTASERQRVIAALRDSEDALNIGVAGLMSEM